MLIVCTNEVWNFVYASDIDKHESNCTELICYKWFETIGVSSYQSIRVHYRPSKSYSQLNYWIG
jgi:hypothetical protein